MKDEALKLALEALDIVKIHFTQNRHVNEAITVIKQALAAPVQEPVGYVAENGVVDWNVCAPPILTDLYTTPPAAQRQWVGLTQDEIHGALLSVDPETKRVPVGFARFAYAIETKIKEKNT
jgi:hypothetical protein